MGKKIEQKRVSQVTGQAVTRPNRELPHAKSKFSYPQFSYLTFLPLN